ncbi:MAG: ferredoxin family protein [Proteobacteria bacterium]|nr:ferredoxin family protein [Pseudomonadota bacterium]
MPNATATEGCAEVSGKFAPFVDRNRCEGKQDCVRVCPYGVFEVRKLSPADRAMLSLIGKLKSWVHGGKQSYVIDPDNCHACRRCIDACPENAIELRPLV